MEKTSLDHFADMHREDCENNTELIAVSPYFHSAKYVKQGAVISMGIDRSAIYEIETGKRMPILLLIDAEEYKKRTES